MFRNANHVVQGDQKVSVHLMITESGAQRRFDHPVYTEIILCDVYNDI